MSDAPHIQPSGVQVPANNGYQLTGEDYENIWLRIKDRSKKSSIAFHSLLLAVVTLVGGVGGYEIAERTLESAVEQHTRSAEFRDSLVSYTRQHIPSMHTELDALEQRAQALHSIISIHQKQIAALQQPPIEINILGARWTAPDGQSLRIEMGRAPVSSFRGSSVTFSPPFATEPVVLVALSDVETGFGRGALWTSKISTEGMEVHSNVGAGTAQWIAIGH